MVLSETGTKRIIQLDKSGLVTVDNYRQLMYDKYKSVASEHISSVSGELIWCSYGSMSVALDSKLLNSIVWHHTAPGIAYETILTVTLPESMTLTNGNYLYGPGTSFGTLSSSQSITFVISYTDDTGTIKTLGQTSFYGLQGVLRDNNHFEFQLCYRDSDLHFSIWSDEFLLPALPLTANKGRYAI